MKIETQERPLEDSAKEKARKALAKASPIDWSKHNKKIDFGPDPLTYLRKMRDEWERDLS